MQVAGPESIKPGAVSQSFAFCFFSFCTKPHDYTTNLETFRLLHLHSKILNLRVGFTTILKHTNNMSPQVSSKPPPNLMCKQSLTSPPAWDSTRRFFELRKGDRKSFCIFILTRASGPVTHDGHHPLALALQSKTKGHIYGSHLHLPMATGYRHASIISRPRLPHISLLSC